MSITRKICFLAAAVAAVSLLWSCASTGNAPVTGVSAEAALEDGTKVVLAVLSGAEIRQAFGSDPEANPFIIKYSIVGTRSVDYLVVRLTIDTPSPLTAELIDVSAVDGTGTVRTRTFDRSDFIEEAAALAPMIENQARREEAIRRNYIPAGTFSVKPGKHSWVIVLRGSHPLPPSLTIRLRGLLNGTMQEMTLPLPDGFTS